MKPIAPEEQKEFTDYILEEFHRGIIGEKHRPMLGGLEPVDPKVAAKALGVLLMPYGVANDIKAVLKKTLAE